MPTKKTKPTITEKQMEEIIHSALKGAKEQAIEETRSQCSQAIGYKVSELIKDKFDELMKPVIAKEIEDYFGKEKPRILKEISKGLRTVGKLMTKRMVEQATENLARSYASSDIIRSIFK